MSSLFGLAGLIADVAGFISKGAAAAASTSNLYVAAIAAAVTAVVVIAAFYYKSCLDSPRAFDACSAGVVEATVPAFTPVTDQVFPFAASHDRVDFVVRSAFWDLVSKGAPYVNCSPTPGDSPMLSAFYHNAAVCGAGLGGTIGAVVGGVVGVFLGVLAAGAIASLSCGPWAWLCAIVALVVAVIVAIVCVIIGAVAGSQIGRGAATSGALPLDPKSPDFPTAISVGDYISIEHGNLVSDTDANGEYVYWFADPGSTHLHGRSPKGPPFSYTDADNAPFQDPCSQPPPPG